MGKNTYSLDLESSSSQYAAIADGSQTGLDLTGDFTIEAWVMPESLPSSGNSMIICGKMSDQSNNRSYRLDITNNGGSTYEARLVVTDDGTWTDGHRIWYGTTPSVFATGRWTHVAWTFNISGEVAVCYINGTQVASSIKAGTNIGATLFNSSASFAIGCDYDSSGNPRNFFDGLVDEVRIWSDVRTASEIKNNIFADLTTGTDNLVDVWKLNNDYTSKSGSNNLTSSGSPVFSTTVPFPAYRELSPYKIDDTFYRNNANIVAYYKAENVNDELGSFNLTNNNSVTFTSAKFDNGANLGTANTNKYLSIADDLNIGATATISISFWVKITTEFSGDDVYVLLQHNSTNASNRYFQCYYQQASSVRYLRVDSAGTSATFQISGLGTSDIHHIVITRSGGNSQLYLNGILVATGTSSTSGYADDHFYIGVDAAGNYANAIIDDVAVFNDLLTANEVFDIYTGSLDYTRGDEVSLPTDDTDLETDYSVTEVEDVAVSDDVRVDQTATNQYMIHQFKDYIGSSPSVVVQWEGQTTWPPSSNTVTLQVYNRDTPGWENLDTDNTTAEDTDFTLSGSIPDTTDYVDADGFISCRVYQQATF